MASVIDRIRDAWSGKDVVQNADSEGVTIDYTGLGSNKKRLDTVFGKSARFSIPKINDVIRNEPAVRTAITTIVDKATEGGFTLIPENEKSNIDAVREFYDDQNAYSLIRSVIADLALYQNAFVEVVRGPDGKASNWNLLEAAYIKVQTKDNGDVLRYEQEVVGGDSDVNPTWSPDEVVHFKIDDYNTATWTEPAMESLWETVLVKDAIRTWLKWFFKTNQLRPVMAIKEGSKQDVKDLIAMIKSMGDHVDKPLPVAGDLTIQFLQDFADQGKSVLDVLNWCNDEIYRLLQTPPISVGQPNESGRSDGAEQRGALYTRVIALQNVVEMFSRELHEKSGFGRVTYRFGALDDKVRKKVFETLQVMNDVGMSEDAMEEYLVSQGIFFDAEDLFREKETPPSVVGSNGQADMAPSRRRQGDQMQEANQEAQEVEE